MSFTQGCALKLKFPTLATGEHELRVDKGGGGGGEETQRV